VDQIIGGRTDLSIHRLDGLQPNIEPTLLFKKKSNPRKRVFFDEVAFFLLASVPAARRRRRAGSTEGASPIPHAWSNAAQRHGYSGRLVILLPLVPRDLRSGHLGAPPAGTEPVPSGGWRPPWPYTRQLEGNGAAATTSRRRQEEVGLQQF